MTTETEEKEKKLTGDTALKGAVVPPLPDWIPVAVRVRLEAEHQEVPKIVPAPLPSAEARLLAKKNSDPNANAAYDIGDDGVSRGEFISKSKAGDPELEKSVDFAAIFSKTHPSLFNFGGSHRAILGGVSPRTCLEVPKLDIPEGTPANDRLLIAAKYFVDHALGAGAGDPRLAKLGIDTSHAWCAETMDAICRAAGLKDSGSALAVSMANVGPRVATNDIKPGDFVVHRDGDGLHGHTGMIWKVNKDAAGHVTSFVMLNGNHGHCFTFAEVSNPEGYATYYRHTGERLQVSAHQSPVAQEVKAAVASASTPHADHAPTL